MISMRMECQYETWHRSFHKFVCVAPTSCDAPTSGWLFPTSLNGDIFNLVQTWTRHSFDHHHARYHETPHSSNRIAMLSVPLLSLLASSTVTAEYALQSNFSGATFFDNFNFYNSWDPTLGFVHYVDRGTAQSMGMISSGDSEPAVFGVDDTGVYDREANVGRASVRLESVQQWTHGLFIADLAHMPGTACGTWPAMWVLGGGAAPWPASGMRTISCDDISTC